MAEREYPSNPAQAALRLFLTWLGQRYARSTRAADGTVADGVLRARITVGRRWSLALVVLDTLSPDTNITFEAARAAVEHRLDAAGRSVALWVPRGAPLPAEEPGLSELALAVEAARPLNDGRLEVRRPVEVHLRRTATTGSVVTVLGGLSDHWAAFTNRVPGTFNLDSRRLYRLPASVEEREALIDRIVSAAAQPEADEVQAIPAEDAWTANDLDEGGSAVLGTPLPETDEWSAALRRNLRKLLRDAGPAGGSGADATALLVLGAATYANEEKLSWALRGMDPSLYAGYDIIAVAADGVVKPLLEPRQGTLPWDVPPPGLGTAPPGGDA
ncbi:MAG: hypothetical protein Kow0010_02810 [Dehalococcoidia bacterium]